MHENREISSTPWSDDQGRSAKATSRTADMYVPEKSDCAVLIRVDALELPNRAGAGRRWSRLRLEENESRSGRNHSILAR
jgi:hypothetical protein